MKSLIGNRTTKTRPGKKKAKYKSYQIKGSTNAKTYGETILMYSRITKKVRQCWNPVKEERGRVEVRSWRLCRFLCHARLSFCFSLQLAAILGLIWIVLFKKKKKKRPWLLYCEQHLKAPHLYSLIITWNKNVLLVLGKQSVNYFHYLVFIFVFNISQLIGCLSTWHKSCP